MCVFFFLVGFFLAWFVLEARLVGDLTLQLLSILHMRVLGEFFCMFYA